MDLLSLRLQRAERSWTDPTLVSRGGRCGSCTQRIIDPAETSVLLVDRELCPGDICMATAAVRDLHRAYPELRIAVDTHAMPLWAHNPHIVPAEPGMLPVEVHYPGIQESNQRQDRHFAGAVLDYLNGELGLAAPLVSTAPDLHLGHDEGPLPGLPERYWLVSAGGKRDFQTKWWAPERFQRVIDATPELSWVQAGSRESAEHVHIPLRGVVDYVGRTDLRQLMRLVAHADGVLCGISLPMHLAAAFGVRAVVVGGGLEPVWWEAHAGHAYLHACQTLPCNRQGGCWKPRCVNLVNHGWGYRPRCMEAITAEHVTLAITMGVAEPWRIGEPVDSDAKPTAHVIANMGVTGGGERSTVELLRALRPSHRVDFWPTENVGDAWKDVLPEVTDQVHEVTAQPDFTGENVLLYLNDFGPKMRANPETWRAALEHSRLVVVFNYLLGELYREPWLASCLRGALFLCSEKRDEWARRVAGTPLADVPTAVLPPPVDLAPFLALPIPEAGKAVPTVGYITSGPNKVPADAVALFEDLAEECPATFHILPGDEALRERFGEDMRFRFFDPAETAVPDFVAGCDLLVYPVTRRIVDQGPRVVVEAMAAGRPVVAERRGGAVDRIDDGANGFLVDAEDRQAMVERTAALVVDGEARRAMGLAAREAARAWSVNAWIDTIRGLWAGKGVPR